METPELKIGPSKTIRAVGLMITMDRAFFEHYRSVNTGIIDYHDILFKWGNKEKSFTLDEFLTLIGMQ